MKKFISGLIVGALLFSGVSVFADSISLVGQKVLVQGLFSIEKNGKKVDDAIIINSTAYAPVRSVSEATGATLTVEGKKIIMSGSETATGTAISNDPSVDLKAKRDETAADILRLEKGIKDLEENVLPGLRESAEILSTNGKIGERAKDTLAQYEAQLVKDKTELAFYRAELTQINTALGE